MDKNDKTQPVSKRGGFAWVPLLGWFVSMGFSTSLFAGGALLFAHAERTRILNRTLAEFAGPYEVTVGSIDFDRTGNVTLGSVTLHDPNDKETVFELGSAGWNWDTGSLIASRYGKLDLDSPKIRIGPKSFASWMAPGTPVPANSDSPSLLAGLVVSLEKIGIQSGSVEFEAVNYPTISFEFEYLGDTIGLKDRRLSAAEQRVEIRDFEAIYESPGSAPSSVRFSRAAIQFQADGDPATLEINALDLAGLDIQITPAALDLIEKWTPDAAAPTGKPDPSIISLLTLDRLRMPDAKLALSGFESASPPLPDCSTKIDFDLDTLSANLDIGTFSVGKQTLTLSDLAVRFDSVPGHLTAQEIATVVVGLTPSGATVESLTTDGVDLHLTQNYLDRLTALGTDSETTVPQKSPAAVLPEFTFGNLEFPEVKIATSHFPGIPDASLRLSTILPGWKIGGRTEFDLPDIAQSLTFSDIRVTAGASSSPLVAIDQIDLLLNPSAFLKSRRIELLQIQNPQFTLNPKNLPALLAPVPSSEPETVPISVPAPSTSSDIETTPAWEGIVIDAFAITGGRFEIEEKTLAGVPAVEFDFHAETKTENGIPTYIVPLTGITATLTSFQNAPFQTTRALTFTVNTDDLWQNHAITELDVDGMTGVMAQELLDAIWLMLEEPLPFEDLDSTPPPSPLPPPPSDTDSDSESPKPKKPWTIGRIRIRNSEVTLRGIAPGLPPVTVGIKADLKGVPFSPDAFKGDLREHQVEIDKINLPSYYNTLVDVAVLKNIWVDFTLDGIANQTIDRVVIGSPTIYVGEHLFWYVDYYRKFLDEGAAPSPDAEQPAAEAPAQSPPTAEAETDNAEPPPSEPEPEIDVQVEGEVNAELPVPDSEIGSESKAGWTVTRLQALNGKLVVAPKGTPVPGFPHPFPFECDTTLESGELHSDFTIPNGTYELPDIKLRIADLFGSVEFNLPIKTLNNNLTETFQAAHLRFHQMEASDLHLSVTYDAYGIYAKFGGAMYDGYINGEFNVYLDAQYTWDSWVAGSAIDTEPLTSVLTPEYFKMDGPIDFTVIANGNASELYQADGKLESKKPGKLTIEALNDALKALPEDWSYYESKVTEIGLETLRDFDYETVAGSFRLFGREGKLNLDLRGPNGSRVFKVNIHDHRSIKLDPDLLNLVKSEAKPDAPEVPEPAANP